MEPWGTPTLTLVHEEDCPFNTTLCFLLDEKCLKTSNTLSDVPFLFNVSIRPLCQAQ